MAVKSSSLSMDLQDCQTRVESTRVDYIKWGTCFNTPTGVWGWIDWQSELIALLKLQFLFWKARMPSKRDTISSLADWHNDQLTQHDAKTNMQVTSYE